MSSIAGLRIDSTVKLNDGHLFPLLGLGVYQNRGDSCTQACLAALKAGYRHIDSAVAYRNEEDVGKAVTPDIRKNIFVTTKITSKNHGYDPAAQEVDASLRRFGFDYIDLYLLHDPLSGKEKRTEAYRALVDAQKSGKIRSVGVSNFNVHHLEEIKAAGLPTPAVNQIELHPYCQQKPIVDYCNANGIVVSAYTPLVRGTFPEGDAISSIAKEKNVTPHQVAVRWSLQRGFVPLPKSVNPDRIVSNADVSKFELSDTEMKAIDALDKGKSGAVTWNPVDTP